MSAFEAAWDLALTVARPALRLAARAPGKPAAAVAGRLAGGRALCSWAETGRRAGDPLLWLHAASAGELAGAAPLVPAVRGRFPSLQVVATCASPSGLVAARELDADFAGFLPWDTQAECGRAVDALRPAAVVFAKGDVWPGLSRAAASRGVPLGLVNGTVSRRSSRLARPARSLLRTVYARLDAVGAASREDAERIVRLGAPGGGVRVTGDAAYAAAARRAVAVRDRGAPLLPPPPGGSVRLVAGSTWPADERALLAACREVTDVQLVLVPHEPSAVRVRRLRPAVRRALGREPVLWSELAEHARGRRDRGGPDGSPGSRGPGPDAPVPVIVDAVGFLAALYLEADLAFVGGASAGRVAGRGLHSVLEPAAAGLAVLFGPRHDRREARELLARGAARVLDGPSGPATLASLVADPGTRARMGTAARAVVEGGEEAVEAAADLVADLLRTGISRRRAGAGA
ncbi:MAG: glycosyltransferase N-terminal domain-containing protein [Gemmatimonadota bacterium]|nr:glycosyltransferase N-terminal domain-containing protein [Gemmatimonadota bacterium]